MTRKVSEEERKLFRKHAADGPLLVSATVAKTPAKPAAAPGGQGREKLRRDQGAPQARIDLHGMIQSQAHRALLAFLAGAQEEGLRLVLVITGVGRPRLSEEPKWTRLEGGVLNEMVPRWLNERAFAPFVSRAASAPRRHGGPGALYVILRKVGTR
ncbi:MAG: Smr/MutS family protein [Rhizomicrobium sp.]